MTSAAFSDAALCLSTSFAVFLMAQNKNFRPEHRPPAIGALIGFLLIAIAALLGSLRYGFNLPLKDVHLMFRNAGVYMGLPLVACAFASIGWPFQWSKPAWGRFMLGLMAMFELIRRMDALEHYQTTLGTISLLVIAIIALKHWRTRQTFALFSLIAAASMFAGGVIIGTKGNLAGFLRLDLFHYLTALGNLLLGSALFIMMRQREPVADT